MTNQFGWSFIHIEQVLQGTLVFMGIFWVLVDFFGFGRRRIECIVRHEIKFFGLGYREKLVFCLKLNIKFKF